jgi:hypothetical protein
MTGEMIIFASCIVSMSLFLANVVASFFLAGSLIALLTLLAERFGSRTGGLITNLPSNILITMIFISLTHGTGFVKLMVPAIPVGMLIDTFFLVAFILLLRYSLFAAVTGSLLTWLILAFLANLIRSDHLWINLPVYLVITLLVWLWIEYRYHIPSVGRSDRRYTPSQIALRALFAGGIVGGVVLVSRFVPAYLTGIISTFPAVLFSSMVILAVNQGKEFARATGKVMIIASSNIVVYAMGVYYTFPTLGIATGTVISFIMAFLWILMMRAGLRYWLR